MSGHGEATESFDFEHWLAIPGVREAGRSSDPATLQVTEVSVTPGSKYAFEVMAGMQRVLTFEFDTLYDALEAARDLQELLPRIEAARWSA